MEHKIKITQSSELGSTTIDVLGLIKTTIQRLNKLNIPFNYVPDHHKFVGRKIYNIFHGNNSSRSLNEIPNLVKTFIQDLESNHQEFKTDLQSYTGDIPTYLLKVLELGGLPEQISVPGVGLAVRLNIPDPSPVPIPTFMVGLPSGPNGGHVRYPDVTEVQVFKRESIRLVNQLGLSITKSFKPLNEKIFEVISRTPLEPNTLKILKNVVYRFCEVYLNRVIVALTVINKCMDFIMTHEESEANLESILDVFKGKDNLSKVADEHLDGWDQQVKWLDEWYHQSIARNMSEGPDTDEPVEVDRKVYECVKGGRKGSVWNMSIRDYPQMMRKVLYASGTYFDKQMSALKKIRDLLKEYNQSPNEALGKRIVEAFKDIPLHPKVGVPSSEDRVSTPFMNGYRVSHTLSKREYGNTKYGQFRLIHISFSQYGYPDLDHVETDGRMTSVQLPLREEYQRYNQEVEKLFKELSGLAQRTVDQHRGLLKQDLTWMQEGDRFFNSVCRAYLDAVGEFVSDRQFTILNVMNALNAWYELGK